MSEIERGSQVRITLTGRYHHGRHNGHWVHIGDVPMFIPATAEVEVVAPPLPPEPDVGRYAELCTTSLDPDVYVRRDAGWMPAWSGLTAITPSTWADLHAWGRVTVLAPVGEPPRYETATRGGMVLWQHECGSVVACTADEDPTADGIDCEDGCHTPDAEWTRLKREVRSDG